MFVHETRDLSMSLHVDDFLLCGEEIDLLWLRDRLQESYQLKAEILGPEDRHAKSGENLRRRLRWESDGIRIETDAKHAVELLKTLGMETSRAASTPLTAEMIKNDMQ